MHKSSEFNEQVFKTYGELLSVAGNYVILWEIMSYTVVIIQKYLSFWFPSMLQLKKLQY